MLSFLGVFVPVIRENMEMLYQFERDYRFDSGKVERAFGLTATTYREGIAATAEGPKEPDSASAHCTLVRISIFWMRVIFKWTGQRLAISRQSGAHCVLAAVQRDVPINDSRAIASCVSQAAQYQRALGNGNGEG